MKFVGAGIRAEGRGKDKPEGREAKRKWTDWISKERAEMFIHVSFIALSLF